MAFWCDEMVQIAQDATDRREKEIDERERTSLLFPEEADRARKVDKYATFADFNKHMRKLICQGELEPAGCNRYMTQIRDCLIIGHR